MRFNAKSKTKTTNYHESKAYQLAPNFDLYVSTVATALHHNFYDMAGDRLKKIRKLISQNDPKFVAKLAVYCREKMYLRSVPLILPVLIIMLMC